jgi:phenylalanyl-tRNA synthetase beta chain
MKISRHWLSDFIEWKETDPAVIADQLTRCVGEVEDIEEQGASLDHVVVGRIQTLEKHPNADRLSVCTVQTEKGTKNVVCGGTNLRKDMVVAFAHVGANLKSAAKGGTPITIAAVTIRGVQSEGMICAAEEMDLLSMFPPAPTDGARPVVDLTPLNLKVGTSLRQALGLTDVVWHIDNHAITNRPDLFSHIGVARELVALDLASWKKLPAKKKHAFPKKPLPFECTNDVQTLIPRYLGCLLTIDGIGETPDWMKMRLEAVGTRSISLPVDITNYAMLECGTPIHSFDADDLKGAVRMRASKKGEKITTLDGIERTLPDGSAIMSDDVSVFDLLGIMGGLRGSTKDTTRTIYLHSAVIDPKNIRRTITALAHRTDAATLSEKGVPLIAAEDGFFRALELFLTLVPGARIASKMESTGSVRPRKSIPLSMDVVDSLIGIPVKSARAKRILTDLGCTVKTAGKKFSVTPPAWRNDLTIHQDLIEEIARIEGYANVPPIMPDASIVPPSRDFRIHRMRDSLKECGFTELVHVSFVSPDLLGKLNVGSSAIALENPIGEELSILRPSVLPSLMATAARELGATESAVLRVFERGHAFSKGKEWDELTMLVAARNETTLPEDPFLLLKRDALRALAAAGHPAVIRSTTTVHTLGHPGRSAEVTVGQTRVGLLFEIHPRIRSTMELPARAAACIIDTSILKKEKVETVPVSPIPAFPGIRLDETLPLGTKTMETLLQEIRTTDPLLRSVDIVDLYEGKGSRTVTIRCTYRADDRTLTQEEVEKVHTRVLAKLKA